MAEEINADGLKVRKLTELRSTAGAENQDAMMKRVADLAVEDNKYQGQVENLIIKGLSTLLDVKIKVDDMLGDNKEKVWKALENILLAF